ncbi:MAG: CehA/McbA family metallohydrolase [Chloroflexi bacterium]|nr:CehA/McbA family metallohydrolase [Chloroflexota bacterium]
MPELVGRVWDRDTGRPLAARVRVVDSAGALCNPVDSILKYGTGDPFFYAENEFVVSLPSGQVDIVVERGTEYRPLHTVVQAPRHGKVEIDLTIARWTSLSSQGWYAGNTHIHYDEKETRPLERLRLDPRVDDLPVFIVSVLQRWDLAYASNAFPIGRHELSTPEHLIDVGEESRHNQEPWTIGYGHIMLVNIKQLVEPMSRGVLVDDSSPDYPPLVDACDRAREQGGVVLWCHNADGMEAPVAGVLGRLDGLNLFDPWWRDPDYDVWYRMLNCGIQIPCSTGSDWYLCSTNRVYTHVAGDFGYESWLGALKSGRTFITDGPILSLSVHGHAPSNDVLAISEMTKTATVSVTWEGAQPVDRVEIIRDGAVAYGHENTSGALGGSFEVALDIADAGWLAARCWGSRRTSFAHPLWAHTSPVYLRARPGAATVRLAATSFLAHIEGVRGWIGARGKFDNAAQRDRLLQLYADGEQAFERLSRS